MEEFTVILVAVLLAFFSLGYILGICTAGFCLKPAESSARRLREMAEGSDFQMRRCSESSMRDSSRINSASVGIQTIESGDRSSSSSSTKQRVGLYSKDDRSSAASDVPTVDAASEHRRVLHDVFMLMTREDLKEACRREFLSPTGLKEDLTCRLIEPFMIDLGVRPTMKQLKYVLYLWRHRMLQRTTYLKWTDVCDKSAISKWIAAHEA